MDKTVFYNLTYGVYLVSTWDNGRPTGCIANSAMQITSEPATIAISINHDNYTHRCIQESKRFALTILTEKTNPEIIGTFGYQSGEKVDKFDKFEYEVKGMLPIIKDACGYVTCEVVNQFETKSHTIFLGKVIEGENMNSVTPMTYAYYQKVIKGKSPKNAPTYIED